MLIDSYPLQRAVLDSEIPGEMLTELDALGVTGLAVLADGLYKPIAVDHPLLSPADYEGITFTLRRVTPRGRRSSPLVPRPRLRSPSPARRGR